jgi:hypothetical protein
MYAHVLLIPFAFHAENYNVLDTTGGQNLTDFSQLLPQWHDADGVDGKPRYIPPVFEDGLIGEEAVLWRDGGNGEVAHRTPQKTIIRVIESLPNELWSLLEHVQSRKRAGDLLVPTAAMDHFNVSNKPSRRKRKAMPADELPEATEEIEKAERAGEEGDTRP